MKHKIFGDKKKAKYLDREGAYIIPILDNKIGVIKTQKGLFLIGGGIIDNESDTDCIKRECLEETGFAVNIKDKICSAEAFVEHSTIGYFHPIQTYYLGELTNKVKEPIEADHTLVWIDYNELNGMMYSEMQNYAINETINMFLL